MGTLQVIRDGLRRSKSGRASQLSLPQKITNGICALELDKAKAVWTGGSANREGDMHEAHFQRIFDMLVEFDEFCQKHDLKYCLAFGTLLGAVRHKDFIPWDHDADLFMSYDSYKKLKELIAAGEGPANRVVVDRWNTSNYMQEFGRYMDTSSTRFNPADVRGLVDDPPGIFIDLFFLLPMRGETDEELDRFTARFQCYAELRNRTVRKNQIRNHLFFQEWEKIMEDVQARGREAVLADLDEELFNVPEEECSYYLHPSSGPAYDWRFKKEDFEHMTRVSMMGHECNVPTGYTRILTTMYGPDYRYYPDDRHVGPGRNLFTSLKVPCAVFQEELLSDVDVPSLLEARDHAKDMKMEESVKLHNFNYSVAEMVVAQQQLHVKEMSKRLGIAPSQALQERNWDTLDQIFESYYNVQREPGLARLRIYVPLEDDDFEAAVLNLVCGRANNHLANKLIQRLLETRLPLTPKQKQVVDFFNLVCSIRDTIETGCPEECRRAVDEVLSQWDCVLDAIACDLWLRIHHEESGDTAWRALASEAHDDYESIGDVRFLFLEAEALLKLGDTARATALYEEARAGSVDGFLLRTIEERIGGSQR